MNAIRPLAWAGAAKKCFLEFPARVQDDFGYRLFRLQEGKAPFPAPTPLKEGLLKGLGIYELGCDYDGDTYRAVYTLKLDGILYVLHAFKKKSKSGIATPRQEIEPALQAIQQHVRVRDE